MHLCRNHVVLWFVLLLYTVSLVFLQCSSVAFSVRFPCGIPGCLWYRLLVRQFGSGAGHQLFNLIFTSLVLVKSFLYFCSDMVLKGKLGWWCHSNKPNPCHRFLCMSLFQEGGRLSCFLFQNQYTVPKTGERGLSCNASEIIPSSSCSLSSLSEFWSEAGSQVSHTDHKHAI